MIVKNMTFSRKKFKKFGKTWILGPRLKVRAPWQVWRDIGYLSVQPAIRMSSQLTLRAQPEPLSHNMSQQSFRRCRIVSDEDGLRILLISSIDPEDVSQLLLQEINEGLEIRYWWKASNENRVFSGKTRILSQKWINIRIFKRFWRKNEGNWGF